MVVLKKNMMHPLILLLPIFVLGCEAQPGVVTEDWIGRWQGVEGTYLDIAKAEGGYAVTIADLDGPREFEGVADKGGLAFDRDGARELIYAGNGRDTGMKWLADKRNCLVVKPGEGYCRD